MLYSGDTGSNWVAVYLSTHSATDERAASRFGFHLLPSGSTTALVAYGDNGSGRLEYPLSKADLEAARGATFYPTSSYEYVLVATPTTSTTGNYDLFITGKKVLSAIPYRLGSGGTNNMINWEVRTNTNGSGRIDNLAISRAPNRAPVWTQNPITGTEATEGQAYSGTLAGLANDLDNEPLTYALVSSPTWLNITTDGTLSGTPGPTHTGNNTFTVSVSDGIATPLQATLNIHVIAVGSPFEQWAGGAEITFTGDSNNDGIPDGMAWLLGAQSPNENAQSLTPPANQSNGNLVAHFKVLNATKRGSAVLQLEYSGNLGTWTSVTVPDSSGSVGIVEFAITPNGDFNEVSATIPASAANGTGKVFLRLRGLLP